MSNTEQAPRATLCGGPRDGLGGAAGLPVHEVLAGKDVVLGGTRGMTVTRTLPGRTRRMVGAWCFVDRYGPTALDGRPGMRVPPHPHTGLQTVSWLVEGEMLHRDTLGSEQLIRPGQLGLMTAGHAIAHSEETPARHSSTLHGVQLWVALPGEHLDTEPRFEHHPDLPVLSGDGVDVTVVMGELAGARSPARVYSSLVGAEVRARAGARVDLPLDGDFEHAVLVLSGAAAVDGVPLAPGPLLYLGGGRSRLALEAVERSRMLLIGGVPYSEEIVMWWNFVGRTHDDVERARREWMAGDRFGVVHGYDGDPLPAPVMPSTRLKPRGRLR